MCVTLSYFSVLHLAEDMENARINGMYKKNIKQMQMEQMQFWKS